MSQALARVGAFAAAKPWRTLVGWLVVLVLAVLAAGTLGGSLNDNYDVKGVQSQDAVDMLRENFPQASGADARVIIHAADGAHLDTAVVEKVRTDLLHTAHVSAVAPAELSADGDTALLAVQYSVPVTEFKNTAGVDALEAAAQPAADAGLQVEFGGAVPENAGTTSGTAEMIGILAALIILLIAFGRIVAAGVPLLVALVGLGVGLSGVTLLAAFNTVSTMAPTVAMMVGLGAGIDYALLMVTRHVEGLKRGLTPKQAAVDATENAGESVLFAGLAVLVSLLALRLAGLPVYSSFGNATAIVVLAVMLTALTMVPALCTLAGNRLLPRERSFAARLLRKPVDATQPNNDRPKKEQGRRIAAWADLVCRRPVPFAIGSLLVLVLLALPVLSMRMWPQDSGTQPTSQTVRRAYDLVETKFGKGFNSPVMVAVDLQKVPASGLAGLGNELAQIPGVVAVGEPQISQSGKAAVLTLIPAYAPYEAQTPQFIEDLRTQLPDGVRATGLTASFVDINERLSHRLWLVIAVVVALSVALLTAVFRAPVVALKAAAMNLLSVAAAYGVMVMAFQWGWASSLFGLPHSVPVSTWVPILMFTVLFGVSMDYEVFLLSRIRERWDDTHDARGSVVHGLARTGRVITCAAAIMVAVFVGFGLDANVTIKMMGVGMAVGVLLDATLVRMVLVPATMTLLGKWNWWAPKWLARRSTYGAIDAEDERELQPAG